MPETIRTVQDRDRRREEFWAEFNARIAAIKADPEAWADLRREDAAWETTLGDGLAGEEADSIGGRQDRP